MTIHHTSPLGGTPAHHAAAISAAYESHRDRLTRRTDRAQAQPAGSRDAAVAKLRAGGYLAQGGNPSDADIVAAVERLRADRDAGRARTAEDSLYASLYPSTPTDPDANLTQAERDLYAALYPGE